MKVYLILLFTSLLSFISKTDEINQLTNKAKKLYASKQYLDVAKVYTLLETKYGVKDPALLYNHANACYRSLQLNTALKYYQIIAGEEDSILSSSALNQMGIISCRTNQLGQGKVFFMEALRRNPHNTSASLNLEWAMLQNDPSENNKSSKESKTKAPKKGQENEDQTKKKKKNDPEGEEEESESLRSQTYKNKYLDLRKARLILESMQNAEKQYIQQLPVNTTHQPNEPAW